MRDMITCRLGMGQALAIIGLATALLLALAAAAQQTERFAERVRNSAHPLRGGENIVSTIRERWPNP